MPAPVTFAITLAPFPVNFTGTAQEWGTAVADRLTITPSAPWSSFQNGGSIPLSDVGPVLYDSMEWRVFNIATGLYTYHRQNGAGLVDATVTDAKLASGTAGAIRIYGADGRPAVLQANGTDGQVVTQTAAGVFGLADTFVPSKEYFETTVSVDQDINTNSSVQVVEFDTVRNAANLTFNTGTFRAPVTGPTVWFVYLNLQVEDTGAASTAVQMQADVRLNGTSTGIGTIAAYQTAQSRFPLSTMGIIVVPTAGYLDVAVSASETTPSATGLAIAGNAGNTRFGGFRIL